ncbi:MAG: DUF4136 domain-containing protein, partial [Pseudomonadota bacterium]
DTGNERASTCSAADSDRGTATGPIDLAALDRNGGQLVGRITAAKLIAKFAKICRDGVAVEAGAQIFGIQGIDHQLATIAIERGQIDGAGRRSPVTVGGGAGTGSFGSGVGLGIGINLGGGGNGPREVTQLSVRITSRSSGATLWEGRAEIATSLDSPYAQAQANAKALADALFKDFPGGNGETVTIAVDELEGTQ